MDQVAALWMLCFRHEETSAPESLRRYFTDVLLDHPWYDPQLAPLVLEQRGEIIGFIGRMARPMRFHGQPIRCAVATQLMVDPRRKQGFAALDLIRAVQSGPQDLCYSDGANDSSVMVWRRCGGEASRLWSFEWARPLRPVRYLTLRLHEHRRTRLAGRILRPVASAIDWTADRVITSDRRKDERMLIRRAASAEEMFPLVQQVSSQSEVYPVYTLQSFRWLLETAAQARSFGVMRKVMAVDDEGQPAGWFIYFVRPGGYARVLQMGAMRGQEPAVLAALFHDAVEQGAVAITGQFDSAFHTVLSNSHAIFHCRGLGVLVHARDPRLLAAIQAGDAFLSRLDGEWWMRFGIDRASW